MPSPKQGERIRSGRPGSPTVAIIGGGFGGIAAGVKLLQAGINTFTIFEQSSDLGGTWWDNRYPGAEVDTASHLYSYSFKRFDWSRTHASREELLQYLHEVADEWNLRNHARLGTRVMSAVWRQPAQQYTVRTDQGEEFDFDAVISALGLLNVPRYPEWPGLETFRGPKFHTARWEPEHDLTGKRVAVVGSGSTACQLVPALAKVAEHVSMFQREPGWIRPKGDRDFTAEERSAMTPLRTRLHRAKLFWDIDRPQWFGRMARPGTKWNTRMQKVCADYIDRVLAGRPDLQKVVTPDYPFYGKRPIASSNFYESLLEPNVTLIPSAVVAVTESGVVDAVGVEHPADVLVMATGFQPANYLATLEVVGREGGTIHQAWAGEPAAYLGIMVPGFPNFFMLYGPNTNGGTIVFNLERQAEFAVACVRGLVRRGGGSVEVRPGAMRLYDRWLLSRIQKTAWVEANNYYKSESGRVVTNWPDGASLYWLMTKLLRGPAVTVRHRPGRGDTDPTTPSLSAGDIEAFSQG